MCYYQFYNTLYVGVLYSEYLWLYAIAESRFVFSLLEMHILLEYFNAVFQLFMPIYKQSWSWTTVQPNK